MQDANTPYWALAAAAAISVVAGAMIGVGYGVVKLWYYVLDSRLEHRRKSQELDDQTCDKDRKSEASEAWEVVKRLTTELEQVTPKIQALTEKCDRIKEECDAEKQEAVERANKCEGDHNATKRILRFVVTWGKGRGMKLTPEVEDELRQITDGSGSGTHRPMQEGRST